MIKLAPLLFCLLVAYGNHAGAQVAFPVHKPAVQMGERWKFVTLDGISKLQTGWRSETVSAVGDDAIVTTVQTSGGDQPPATYDSSWNGLIDLKGRTEREVKNSFPLELGKTWSSSWEWINARGNEGRMEMTYRVGQVEKVSVAAGQFEAVFIDGSGKWFNKTNGSSGVVIEKRWYAPDAKRFVRRIWTTRFATGQTDQNFIVEAAEMALMK